MSPNNGMIPHARRWKAKRKPTRLGRPTRLTAELVANIMPFIRDGNSVETACLAVGIARSTFQAWKKRGHEDRTAGVISIFSDFLDEVEQAEALSKVDLLKGVKREQGGKRWILSRRFRNEFGDQVDVNLGGAVSVVVEWPEDEAEE